MASVVALTFGFQNFAWAICADGTSMPHGGFQFGSLSSYAQNFSPNVFTAPAGGIFIPDTSVYEQNADGSDGNPKGPLTLGGHNWIYDQGSTLCKETDATVDPATGATRTWAIPPNTATDCVVYPNIVNNRFVNLGSIPNQDDAITPTCIVANLTTLLSPPGGNPANTYLNQLGCAISAFENGGVPVDTDVHVASTFLAGAGGVRSGSFINQLDNIIAGPPGSDAGKINGPVTWMQAVPTGQAGGILDHAAWSNDGMFVMYESGRRGHTALYACLNPLGDPGDPTQPYNFSNFFIPPGDAAENPCMVVGQHGLAVGLTVQFGPDNQPYVGGQRVINSFGSTPGGPSKAAWPQCIYANDGGVPFPFASFPHPTLAQLQANLKVEFAKNAQNGCNNMVANGAFTSALVTQPNSLITHKLPNSALDAKGTAGKAGGYMYTGPLGGTVQQFKVTTDQLGFSHYASRTILVGVSLTTGLSVAEDLRYPLALGVTPDPVHPGISAAGSLIVMTDPTAVGLAAQGVMTRLPLCEDM